MHLDLFETNDVIHARGRRRFLPELRAADWWVVAVLCVGVFRVVSEANLAGRRAWAGFVFVGHVHDVVLEGGVVVVFEAAWGGVAYKDFDVRLWKHCAPVFAQIFGYFWGATKAHYRTGSWSNRCAHLVGALRLR